MIDKSTCSLLQSNLAITKSHLTQIYFVIFNIRYKHRCRSCDKIFWECVILRSDCGYSNISRFLIITCIKLSAVSLSTNGHRCLWSKCSKQIKWQKLKKEKKNISQKNVLCRIVSARFHCINLLITGDHIQLHFKVSLKLIFCTRYYFNVNVIKPFSPYLIP